MDPYNIPVQTCCCINLSKTATWTLFAINPSVILLSMESVLQCKTNPNTTWQSLCLGFAIKPRRDVRGESILSVYYKG